ncbi:MAG: hypothetical protein IJZ34_00850 [Lachnospiraceae bacterium]|nr:hypothetical protein [Lachnospiraceae bacterium]
MKIMLDTNVLISAFVFGGRAGKLYRDNPEDAASATGRKCSLSWYKDIWAYDYKMCFGRI